MRDPYSVLGVAKGASRRTSNRPFANWPKSTIPIKIGMTLPHRQNLPRSIRPTKSSATKNAGLHLIAVRSMPKARNVSRALKAPAQILLPVFAKPVVVPAAATSSFAHRAAEIRSVAAAARMYSANCSARPLPVSVADHRPDPKKALIWTSRSRSHWNRLHRPPK